MVVDQPWFQKAFVVFLLAFLPPFWYLFELHLLVDAHGHLQGLIGVSLEGNGLEK